jgi:hypothetical protein
MTHLRHCPLLRKAFLNPHLDLSSVLASVVLMSGHWSPRET